MVLKNLKIDMRGYANSTAIEIYNVKVSIFEDLSIYNYANRAFYLEGFNTSSTGYTFWNTFRNIITGNPTYVSDRVAFYVTSKAIDSWIDTVYGDVKGGYGFYITGGGSWTIRNFWLTSAKTVFFFNATNPIGGLEIENAWVDYVTQHGFYFRNTATGNVFSSVIRNTHFIVSPSGYDLFYFEGYSGKTFSSIKIYDSYATSTTHRYIANWDGVGTFATSNKFRNNKIPAGSSGTYNNIPAVNIENDFVFITENSGVTSIKNNDFIAHGLTDTPKIVTITPTAQRLTAVLFKNSTHFQVGLWDNSGNAITTPEDVYWYGEV
jgi:hypothetical protein